MWDDFCIWISVCFTISMLFAVATFIVYTVTPELRNLEGSIFRSCLAAYICFLLCTTLSLSFTTTLFRNHYFAIIGIISGFAAVYFGAVYILWLNLMSFDIWKKFRNIRPRSDISLNKKREKAKFIRYSIYAWAGSLVPISVFGLGTWFAFIGPFYRYHDTTPYRVFIVGLPVLITSICNACFYVLTALKIRKLKAETSRFTEGENKHHKQNEEWFNLYLKLFVIMDGPLMFYVIVLYYFNYTVFQFISVLEGMQGILIFLIFVWKDDVKRSFHRQFVETMRRLSSFFRYLSTLVIRNRNAGFELDLTDSRQVSVPGSTVECHL